MGKIIAGLILIFFVPLCSLSGEPILISPDAAFIIMGIGISTSAFGFDELYRKKK